VVFIYEDGQWRNLLPLVHLRPVFDLRCGRRTLLEKYRALYPREKFGLLVRSELCALAREQHPEVRVEPADSAICNLQSVICNRSSRPSTPVLFLSGRAILDKPLPVRGTEEVFVNGDELVGFRVNPARLRRFRRPSSAVRASVVRAWCLPERKVLASIVKFPWNLIEFNEPELVRELRVTHDAPDSGVKRQALGVMPRFLVVGNPRNLSIARSAQIDPGVVLDLRLGRILIDEHARVRARSVVAGPCYIGKSTVIDAALIRPGCSFGPDCRIGGEVEASIFLGHANKHHEGFIGHAVVGEWVNLGALTANSDLRNDYGEVKVTLNGRAHNTLLRKFGCVIGDHAKTAIGSLLNTGAVLGIFANWFEPGLSPKLVPDFARGSARREPLEASLATARIVMSRRGVRLSPDYERLVRRAYARR
jgi:UDP-N-acetylglucosamine diphosphorylase/glucosamine-1-phosphate N-acetyltransferase